MQPVRNTFLSLVVSGSRMAGMAVALLLAAQRLGPEQFGVLTYALTAATLIAVIPDYGFGLQIVGAIARDRGSARSLLRAATHAKTALVLGAAAAAVPIALLTPDRSLLLVLAVFVSSAIAHSYAQLNTFALRGCNRFDLDAVASCVLNLTLIAGVIGVLLFGSRSVLHVALVFLCARLLYWAVTQTMLRVLPPAGAPLVGGWRSVLRHGFPYGLHMAAVVLYLSFDSLLLQYTAGAEAVGYYQAGVRLLFVSSLLPEVLTAGLYPALAAGSRRGDGEYVRRLGRFMNRCLLLGGVAVAAVLATIPGSVRTLLLGPQFAPLDAWLPGFGLLILLSYVVATYGVIVTASDAQRERTRVTVFAAGVNVVLNLLLVPRYGIAAALASALVTQAVLLAGYVLLSTKYVRDLLLDWRTVLGAAAVGTLSVAIVTIGRATHPISWPLVIAAIAFTTLAFAISREELQKLWRTRSV